MTILWDFPIRTDRTIQANRPDIIIKHKQNKTCQLIDMSVPSDSNISAKEFEKLSKYKDLEIEIAKRWKMKIKIIPVIVGALGMIKKGTQNYVNEIPGNLPLVSTNFLCSFITKFFIYNIYTIQIHHSNFYQNYMRLERNIHKHEWPSTLGIWL